MATYSFHSLEMGKEKIANFSLSMGLFELLKKILFSSPLHFIRLLSKSLKLIGRLGGKKGKFS